MLFDSAMLGRISAELNVQLVGCRIRRAIATAPTEVALETTAVGPARWLVLCADPQFGRVHISEHAAPRPDIHSPLADVLRRYLRGARLEGVAQVDFDRCLQLVFINAQGLGPGETCTLVVEVMGRRSNVLLLDDEGVILECLKHVPAGVNRYRQSLPGVEYVAPPSFGKVNPLTVTKTEWAAQIAAAEPSSEFATWFRETCHGASDLFVAEVAARSGFAADTPVNALIAGDGERLFAAIAQLRELIAGPGEAYVCRDTLGETVFAYPFVPQSRPGLVTTSARSLSAALDRIYSELRERDDMRELRQRLLGAAGKQLDHILVRRRKRQAALAGVDDADRYRKWGELILTHLHQIPPGAEQITVTDYYSPSQSQVTIPLDPDRTPQVVAQHYFKRYKRAGRLRQRLPRLIRVDRIQQDYLEGLMHQIQSTVELADLEELRDEMIGQGMLKPPKRPQPRPQKRRLPSFSSIDGYAVWYGKTGRQNDELLRAASPDDIWLHVQQGPGGHVIIKTGGRPDEVPESTIVEAAGHAAALSRQAQSAKVEVDYTQVKHLSKPRGAPPGFVLYRNFKAVRIAPQRIETPEVT